MLMSYGCEGQEHHEVHEMDEDQYAHTGRYRIVRRRMKLAYHIIKFFISYQAIYVQIIWIFQLHPIIDI